MFTNKNLFSNACKLVLIAVFFVSCNVESKMYKVEVTFCDNRPKKIVTINSFHEPSNADILTYKKAVPEWENYLNVCEIRVIK
jgi:hypothetical protein